MKNDFLYYAPRIITIMFILIIGLFVQDVFNDAIQTPSIAMAIFINLIPHMVLILALLFAWNHEKTGGMIFLFLFLVALTIFKNPFPTNIVLFAPLPLIGLLFEFHYAKTNKKNNTRFERKLRILNYQKNYGH